MLESRDFGDNGRPKEVVIWAMGGAVLHDNGGSWELNVSNLFTSR